ncbi:hypothetical protein NEOKW01_1820 [Nematocida sp. AWRm80]|nr:hypothetical protein NEOKW01_1820 [Nematocida sp. AWRm80]
MITKEMVNTEYIARVMLGSLILNEKEINASSMQIYTPLMNILTAGLFFIPIEEMVDFSQLDETDPKTQFIKKEMIKHQMFLLKVFSSEECLSTLKSMNRTIHKDGDNSGLGLVHRKIITIATMVETYICHFSKQLEEIYDCYQKHPSIYEPYTYISTQAIGRCINVKAAFRARLSRILRNKINSNINDKTYISLFDLEPVNLENFFRPSISSAIWDKATKRCNLSLSEIYSNNDLRESSNILEYMECLLNEINNNVMNEEQVLTADLIDMNEIFFLTNIIKKYDILNEIEYKNICEDKGLVDSTIISCMFDYPSEDKQPLSSDQLYKYIIDDYQNIVCTLTGNEPNLNAKISNMLPSISKKCAAENIACSDEELIPIIAGRYKQIAKIQNKKYKETVPISSALLTRPEYCEDTFSVEENLYKTENLYNIDTGIVTKGEHLLKEKQLKPFRIPEDANRLTEDDKYRILSEIGLSEEELANLTKKTSKDNNDTLEEEQPDFMFHHIYMIAIAACFIMLLYSCLRTEPSVDENVNQKNP